MQDLSLILCFLNDKSLLQSNFLTSRSCIDHLFDLINKDNKKKFEYYSIRQIEITSKLEPRVQILKKPLLALGWKGKFEFNLLFES